MAFSDAYQVRIHQTQGAVNLLNVIHVERLTVDFGASDIREAFIDTVLPTWKSLVVSGLVFASIDVVSLSNPEDFEIAFPIGQQGNGSGLVGPALIAANLRLNRTRTDVRNGSIRIGGISEDSYNVNAFVSSFRDDMSDFGDALLDTWAKISPAGNVCQVHVIKRVLVPATSTHKAYYRLPENTGEYISYHPTQHTLNVNVSSQVSRKLPSSAS